MRGETGVDRLSEKIDGVGDQARLRRCFPREARPRRRRCRADWRSRFRPGGRRRRERRVRRAWHARALGAEWRRSGWDRNRVRGPDGRVPLSGWLSVRGVPCRSGRGRNRSSRFKTCRKSSSAPKGSLATRVMPRATRTTRLLAIFIQQRDEISFGLLGAAQPRPGLSQGRQDNHVALA